MLNLFKRDLTQDKISEIENAVKGAYEEEDTEQIFETIQPLIHTQANQNAAAKSLVTLTDKGYFDRELGLDMLEIVFENHDSNIEIVSSIASALESVRDIDDLNSPPSDHYLFESVVKRLKSVVNDYVGDDNEKFVLEGLATAARMTARQNDDIAERSYRRLTEVDPEYSSYQYGLGLFCKTRGKFEEGVKANQRALQLVDEPVESYLWNLGICATGARQPEIALDIWKGMGNTIEMGRFDLPDGRYPQCKVKLAERPLAERDSFNDNPGLEETIWIERLSPCHGIIRSVLYQDLGVNYGDVILIDGAPITYHTYGEEHVPVFPHLTTLVRNGYKFFDFVATQEEKGEISDLSSSLEGDSVVYVHTEQYQLLCSCCWRNSENDHQQHDKEEMKVVKGRIAVSKNTNLRELIEQLDKALLESPNCELYSPNLCEEAGFESRAKLERRRIELLSND